MESEIKNMIVEIEVCTESISEQRKIAKEADKEAATAGVNRVTVFFEGNSVALIVKPNFIPESWFIHFYGGGYMTIPKDVLVEFEIKNQRKNIWRFSLNVCGFIYWNNLIDQDMASDLAKFLNLPLTL